MFDNEIVESIARPFCRCCGSRNIMTIDVEIAECEDWNYGSFLKNQRLRVAISKLDEGELSGFVLDALPYMNVEEDYEVEFGLQSYLADLVIYSPDIVSDYDGVGPAEIARNNRKNIEQERKRIFLDLWGKFDVGTKTAFLQYAEEDTAEASCPK